MPGIRGAPCRGVWGGHRAGACGGHRAEGCGGTVPGGCRAAQLRLRDQKHGETNSQRQKLPPALIKSPLTSSAASPGAQLGSGGSLLLTRTCHGGSRRVSPTCAAQRGGGGDPHTTDLGSSPRALPPASSRKKSAAPPQEGTPLLACAAAWGWGASRLRELRGDPRQHGWGRRHPGEGRREALQGESTGSPEQRGFGPGGAGDGGVLIRGDRELWAGGQSSGTEPLPSPGFPPPSCSPRPRLEREGWRRMTNSPLAARIPEQSCSFPGAPWHR